MSRNSSIILIVILIINFCNKQKSSVAIEYLQNNHPVKLLVGGTKGDSTKIRMFVPQEVKLRNQYPHKVRLSLTYLSMNGGNIMAENPLFQMKDSLIFSKSRTFQSGEEETYLFYAGYLAVVHKNELDSLKLKGYFIQLKNRREVYNIGSLTESSNYLNSKVPDSLKGFIHLDFYNFKNKLGFVENIPVKF